jgi:hypothetical protein
MNDTQSLLIEGTAKTPQIDFNQLTGEMILSGVSLPENAAGIYEPLLGWINDYIKSPHQTTNLRLNLEYYNSSSSLYLAKMIKALSKINEDDHVLFIHIYFNIDDFNDMDMEEIKKTMGSLMNIVDDTTVSIGVKAYGTDENHKIVKESTILF